jgi:PhzF family phenazine biosynthesis protein
MKVKVIKINAFTDLLKGGNPAGVVINSPDLTERQMKYISKTMQVSETGFIFPSKKADYKVRYFSQKVEVSLCGHATIATFFALYLKGAISGGKNVYLTQETKAGVLPVKIYFNEYGEIDRIMMTQIKPRLKNIYLDISTIADSLNISEDVINDSFPKQIVSTGLFTLPLCIDSFDTLSSIEPDFEKIKKICKKLNVGSFHLFTFDTIDSESIYHARNFAPIYGINEDPVTGTANGAVCSYLLKNNIIKECNLICEQGDIIKRPGRVFVEIGKTDINVGGRARFVEERDIY